MQKEKQIDVDVLPPEVKTELFDFYEYLVQKYCVVKFPKAKKPLRSKKAFFASLKKHSFKMPHDFAFCRDELHER